MEVRFVAPDLRKLDALSSEALSIVFFQDERPLRGAAGLVDWRLGGFLSRAITQGHFSGALNDRVLVPTRRRLGFDKLFLFGAGPESQLSERIFVTVVERILATLHGVGVRASLVSLPGRSTDAIGAVRAAELFLEATDRRPVLDRVTLIEPPAAQQAIAPVVERQRRRERAGQIPD